MNLHIEWEGGVPEPLASIYGAMGGDEGAMLRAARLLWGDELVGRAVAESGKVVGRVEDILDGADPLERIEERLDGLVASRSASPYLTVEEAGAYCRLAVGTLYNHRREIQRLPGTSKLLFRREDLDAWLQTRRRKR